MKLVVDTNAILSGLVKDSSSREIIRSEKFEFFTLSYAFKEIEKYKHLILEKSKLKELDFQTLLQEFKSKVKLVDDELVEPKVKEAMDIMHLIDEKDAPILACALAIENDGIWSQDRHFEKQNKVKYWKTEDLIGIVRDSKKEEADS